MKFIVNKRELSEAISKLSRAVANKSSVPVLEGILFSAEEGKLTMASYNYEMGMRKELDINCIEPGDIVLTAKLLGDIIRRMPEENVTISVNEKLVCHIESGTSHFDIVGIDASDFPEIPSTVGGNYLSMPGSMLKAMVRQTIFAVEEENSMPMYTGIYFEIESEYIKLVALDGLRIAIRQESAKNENTMNFVATGKSLNEVFRLIEDESQNVAIQVTTNHVSFKIGDYYLVSRLIEGTYLDYNSVIKKEEKTQLTINTNEIIETIERISLIINNPKNTPVRCTVTDEEMNFTCATTMGRASDTCCIEKTGDNIEFGFNAKFMLDAMKATETDQVIMSFNGDLSPIMIKPKAGNEFTYIVMPMRIRNV